MKPSLQQALEMWTDEYFWIINGHLSESYSQLNGAYNMPTINSYLISDVINVIIENMQVINNDNCIYWRGERLRKNEIATSFTRNTFTSITSDKDVAYEFGTQVVMISLENGLKYINVGCLESEVLIEPNTYWKYLGFANDNNKMYPHYKLCAMQFD